MFYPNNQRMCDAILSPEMQDCIRALRKMRWQELQARDAEELGIRNYHNEEARKGWNRRQPQ